MSGLLQRAFLPDGYPHSVADGYLGYVLLGNVADFFGQVSTAIGDYAFLMGLGFGSASATLYSAVYRDTLIKLARYLFAVVLLTTVSGRRFDRDCRRYLLTGGILNSFTVYLYIVGAYYFPPRYYVAFAVVKVGIETSLGATLASAGYSLQSGLARRSNMGDMAAKGTALSSLFSLVAMGARFLTLRWVDGGGPAVMWALLVGSHALYLAIGLYRAWYFMRMDVLNLARLRVCLEIFTEKNGGGVPSVREGNSREPLLLGWGQPRRHFGCPLTDIPSQTDVPTLLRRANYSSDSLEATTVLAYDPGRREGWVCASESATDRDLFHAVVQLEFAALKLKGRKWWGDEWDEEVAAFESSLVAQGWRLTAMHFGFGKHRFSPNDGGSEGCETVGEGMKGVDSAPIIQHPPPTSLASRVKATLQRAYLPDGYPDSVAPNYLKYLLYAYSGVGFGGCWMCRVSNEK